MSTGSREMMFHFCEPYFHAVNRWMEYKDVKIMEDHIHGIARLANHLLEQNNPDRMCMMICVENPEIPLLPAIKPSVGEFFSAGLDHAAFNAASNLVDSDVFQVAGLYFQRHLLRALSIANTSQSHFLENPTIVAISELLRTPETSGFTALRISHTSETTSSSGGISYPSDDADAFISGLLEIISRKNKKDADHSLINSEECMENDLNLLYSKSQIARISSAAEIKLMNDIPIEIPLTGVDYSHEDVNVEVIEEETVTKAGNKRICPLENQEEMEIEVEVKSDGERSVTDISHHQELVTETESLVSRDIISEADDESIEKDMEKSESEVYQVVEEEVNRDGDDSQCFIPIFTEGFGEVSANMEVIEEEQLVAQESPGYDDAMGGEYDAEKNEKMDVSMDLLDCNTEESNCKPVEDHNDNGEDDGDQDEENEERQKQRDIEDTDIIIHTGIDVNAESEEIVIGKGTEEISSEFVEKKKNFEVYKGKLRDGVKDLFDDLMGKTVKKVKMLEVQENIDSDDFDSAEDCEEFLQSSTLSENQIILFKSYVHHYQCQVVTILEEVEEGGDDVLTREKNDDKAKLIKKKKKAIDVYRSRHKVLQILKDGKKKRSDSEREPASEGNHNGNMCDVSIGICDGYDDDDINYYDDMGDEAWILERQAIYNEMVLGIRLSNSLQKNRSGSRAESDDGSGSDSSEGSSSDMSMIRDIETHENEKNEDDCEDRNKSLRTLVKDFSGSEKLEAEFENEIVEGNSDDDNEINDDDDRSKDDDDEDENNDDEKEDDEKTENEKNEKDYHKNDEKENDEKEDDNSEHRIDEEPSTSTTKESNSVCTVTDLDITDPPGNALDKPETESSKSVKIFPMTKKKKRLNNLIAWKSRLLKEKEKRNAHEEEEKGEGKREEKENYVECSLNSSSSSSSSSSRVQEGNIDKTKRSGVDKKLKVQRESSHDQLNVKRERRSLSPSTSSSSSSVVKSASEKKNIANNENKKRGGRAWKKEKGEEKEKEKTLVEKDDKREKKRGRRSSSESGVDDCYVDDDTVNAKGSKKVKIDHNSKEGSSKKVKMRVVKEEKITWSKKHVSVGTKVANFFETGKGKKGTVKKYYGKVTKHAGESSLGAKDELYHIVWDDGDEEDYDLKDLKSGEKKYKTFLKENR